VVQSLENGDVKVTFLQDFGINDNTYGTGAIGGRTGTVPEPGGERQLRIPVL